LSNDSRSFFINMHINQKTSSGQLSDEILIARVTRGDRAALEALYDRHAARVMGVCVQIIADQAAAEDVLQETFWRVWQNAATYQSQRGSFTGWLFRIARNLAIDVYRRDRSRPLAITETTDADPILDQIPDLDVNVSEQTQANLDAQQVRNALKNLPREQRQVIELAYFYGMTRQEISEATGEALGTIHTRARLGLQKLRRELERLQT
jgi:RNA polymerase sigma-70 factor (ECF subfamily)